MRSERQAVELACGFGVRKGTDFLVHSLVLGASRFGTWYTNIKKTRKPNRSD